jgi:hypothetical protein
LFLFSTKKEKEEEPFFGKRSFWIGTGEDGVNKDFISCFFAKKNRERTNLQILIKEKAKNWVNCREA